MRQWTIDAFASEPFKGNPACVVEPMAAWPAAERMQALAAENNQAETAFLLATDDPARFGLRWFTPALEVPLCGHATLASAHALFSDLRAAVEAISFDTLSGPLIVSRSGGGYRMDFPASTPRLTPAPPGLAEALGAELVEVWAAQYLVAIVADEAAVRAIRPDLAALKDVASAATGGRGNVGVSAIASPGGAYDVVSRFFAPGSGIPEDPTTGSLHCILSPLFSAKLGRAALRFHQAHPGRGGDLTCEFKGERVLIGGSAVTVAESRLRITL
ncbi:MAG TPA: PhzF family phenazine biosynthesis protein [Caulobacteraceae bacterium]|nr:PhzF family phenazine biosynthesis protein [Caulobacteraceae bacterium]